MKKKHFRINRTLLAGIIFSCMLVSCSKKINLSYDKSTRSFIKKDTTTSIYYVYNEDSGIKIPFFNVDTIYGNKKKAWISATVNNIKYANSNISIYSCRSANNLHKGIKMLKKLGDMDATGRIKFKLRYKNQSVFFMSTIPLDYPDKALMYILHNVIPNGNSK